jgi:hypothetical protein
MILRRKSIKKKAYKKLYAVLFLMRLFL